MAPVPGRRMALSAPRRLVCDLLHASRNIPVVTFERSIDVSAVAAARRDAPHPPPWAVLFVKAFALVASRRPELRRAYLPLPWPHLWEAAHSVASVAVEREYRGEPAVLFGLVKNPEARPLAELVAKLNEWKTRPVEAVGNFNRQLRYARLPLPVRRLVWRYATAWSGAIKARNLGTFGVSLTGAGGAAALNLICPLTASLNTGVIRPDGTVDVRLHFDHRVLDGMPAARALADLEEVLAGAVAAEVRGSAATSAASCTAHSPGTGSRAPRA
ncbi:hypothetical protein [Gemmata sp.]|uniref:hypothetical protein n=1 Tax=Gemmata sp. TaxID=1914242 RepID=UPI003F6F0A2B